MNRHITLGLPLLGLIFCFALFGAAAAEAAEGHNPRIVTHMVPWTKGMRLNCFEHGVTKPEDVVTKGTAPEAPGGEPQIYLIYVLVTGFEKENGLGGIQFGIAYDPKEGSGLDITGWQDCASMEFHEQDWPLAGTGNLCTWETKKMCQREEPVVVGFFAAEVHSPDTFKIIPRPVDTRAAISNCIAEETELGREMLGTLEFGLGEGYNPWDDAQLKARLKTASNSK